MYYNVYQKPYARAILQGDSDNPHLRGRVTFYDCGDGVIVNIKVNNLPYTTPPVKARSMRFICTSVEAAAETKRTNLQTH